MGLALKLSKFQYKSHWCGRFRTYSVQQRSMLTFPPKQTASQNSSFPHAYGSVILKKQNDFLHKSKTSYKNLVTQLPNHTFEKSGLGVQTHTHYHKSADSMQNHKVNYVQPCNSESRIMYLDQYQNVVQWYMSSNKV